MRKNKKVAIFLFIVLLGLSFLKDDFTPDFLNSPSAHFLNPDYHVSRLGSIKTQGMFWFASILYSLLFIFLPYKIITFYFEIKLVSKLTAVVLSVMCVSIYLMIFMNMHLLDYGIIPKINRYFHSPILTLFFIAAFSIIKTKNQE